jgi:AraC family transcriptional regulator of adaptative response/methylated-DNA-[protein]-cysteine methyltransferase
MNQPVIPRIGVTVQSAGGFWQAHKKVLGVPTGNDVSAVCLRARLLETPLGPMIAMANNDGLYLLEFVDRRGLKNEILFLRKRTGFTVIRGDNSVLELLGSELNNYFKGKSLKFTVPLKTVGSEFERSVWKILETIPPGTTTCYSHIAKELGKPDASRAVGRANGRNCIAILLPCHRVINADGTISNYGGGIWRKRWLLEHERHTQGIAGRDCKNRSNHAIRMDAFS